MKCPDVLAKVNLYSVHSRWAVLRQPKKVVLVLICLLFTVWGNQALASPTSSNLEYEIKAGLLYKFLYFIDWPKSSFTDPSSAIKICLMGDRISKEKFNPVKDEKVYGRPFVIQQLNGNYDGLAQCHLLFFNASGRELTNKLLKTLTNYPVLTVGELDGFARSGGMIGFVYKNKRIRFEINKQATKDVNIQLRSKLLRLATRIYGENKS